MKLKIINSTSHWVMPRIVMGILVVLLVIIYLMEFLTFLPASIISIFIFNVLFDNERTKKSMITSGVISVGFSVFIWLIFGVLFRITIP